MSVTENRVDFKSFEQEVFYGVCRLGQELIREALERYDVELSESRDKSIYRSKDLRRTTIKTVMGEVEYYRTMYEVVDEDGCKRYVYLLDETIGKTGGGFFSELLLEMIAKAACESSFRNAARSVSELTGQKISHTAAWSAVQRLGERLNAQESEAAALAKNNKGKGTLETKVLFEEMDGIFLNLQGESREKHGASKEMKVANQSVFQQHRGRKRAGKLSQIARIFSQQ